MSRLELKFDTLWRALRGPALAMEFRFHPSRRWRFDRALPSARVAIELEGGIWSGGRHTRGTGFEGDCEKYNAAQLLGWTVFRLTGRLLTADSIEPIIRHCTNGGKHEADIHRNR
jgi:very-short-patch-repair endonuclease